MLTKYGLERMLFRLSTSKYRDMFILKGAPLFELWTKERYRATATPIPFKLNADPEDCLYRKSWRYACMTHRAITMTFTRYRQPQI
jgi:hypothetical protein